MKISTKKMGGVWGSGWGGQVGGVRLDVIKELRFWGKFTKKIQFGGLLGGGVGSGVGGFRLGGVRVDVNEELKFL